MSDRPPETPAERTARQLDSLRDLTESAVALARDAATAALEDSETPPDPAQPKRPDHGAAFVRYAQLARHLITAEAKLAAEPKGTAPKPAAAEPKDATPAPPLLVPHDPRRLLLRRALHEAVRHQPDLARVRRVLDAAIERYLADDPTQQRHPGSILRAICREVSLTIDPAQLPDELLIPPPHARGMRPGSGFAATPKPESG